MIKKCLICNKEIKTRYSHERIRKYCSYKCFWGNLIGKPHGHKTNPGGYKILKGHNAKEKHWNWQGGKSLEGYTINWTQTLKRAIRERDKFTCQICGKQQGGTTFQVHHIDYNKKNCNPENLVTLCTSCHVKTNFNRERWIKHFQTMSLL